MNHEVKIQVPMERKDETDEVMQLVHRMDALHQRELLTFLRGVAFGQALTNSEKAG